MKKEDWVYSNKLSKLLLVYQVFPEKAGRSWYLVLEGLVCSLDYPGPHPNIGLFM